MKYWEAFSQRPIISREDDPDVSKYTFTACLVFYNAWRKIGQSPRKTSGVYFEKTNQNVGFRVIFWLIAYRQILADSEEMMYERLEVFWKE